MLLNLNRISPINLAYGYRFTEELIKEVAKTYLYLLEKIENYSRFHLQDLHIILPIMRALKTLLISVKKYLT